MRLNGRVRQFALSVVPKGQPDYSLNLVSSITGNLTRERRLVTLTRMTSKRTLQGVFEARGEFWRPEKPDVRVAGRLRYKAGSINVELFGSFSRLLREGDLFETEFILGSTELGPCTLWDAIRTRATARLFAEAELPQSEWTAAYLFLGAHFDRAEEIVFTSASFAFDCLEGWLARSPFEVTIEKDLDGRSITTARHDFRESPTVELASHGAKLELDFLFTRGGELFRSLDWQEDAAFKVAPSTPQTFTWVVERLGDLRALLGVLVGEAATPVRVWGQVPGVRAGVEFFFPYVGEAVARPPHPAEMIVSANALGDRFAATIEAWFAKRDRLQTTIALLFGTLYTPDLPGEFRFLALTQALETFHRRTREGRFLSHEDYTPVKQRLLETIPDGIPDELREALKTRIHFGNEFTQQARLGELMDSLEEQSRDLVSSDPEFTTRVVKQRNYLTHYPERRNPPMAPRELYYTSVRLRGLLTLLLLQEIDIVGPQAVEGLRRTRWYRGFLASST